MGEAKTIRNRLEIPFHQVDNRIYDPEEPWFSMVGLRAMAIYCYLSRLGQLPEGRIFPTHKAIARATGQSQNSVKRALSRLEALGMLTQEARFTERGDRSSNAYTLEPLDFAQVSQLIEADPALEWSQPEHGPAALPEPPPSSVRPDPQPTEAPPPSSVRPDPQPCVGYDLEIREKERGSTQKEEKNPSVVSPAWPSPEAWLSKWNQHARTLGLPQARTLGSDRKQNITRALKELPEEQTWDQIFANYHLSEYLRGELPHLPSPDCDWLLAKRSKSNVFNFNVVLEGHVHRDRGQIQEGPADPIGSLVTQMASPSLEIGASGGQIAGNLTRKEEMRPELPAPQEKPF